MSIRIHPASERALLAQQARDRAAARGRRLRNRCLYTAFVIFCACLGIAIAPDQASRFLQLLLAALAE